MQVTRENNEIIIRIPDRAGVLNMREIQDYLHYIVLSEPEIGTQQAADILNVSRTYLLKLLEDGTIPYQKIGTIQRIKLKDVLVYEKNRKEVRRKYLDLLAEEAQELKLGYE